VGALLASPIGDWLGRKKPILMGANFFLIGGGLQTGARRVIYLFAGRASAGFVITFPPFTLHLSIPHHQTNHPQASASS